MKIINCVHGGVQNPKVLITLPKNLILLKVGEHTKKGDRYYDWVSQTWKRVGWINRKLTVGEIFVYARRIKNASKR